MKRSGAKISASLRKVPPFPPVAAKLLTVLSKPDAATSEVADLISSDATFTARLLQRANSAEFGFTSAITNVRRAVALLGLDATRQTTVAHATSAYSKGALGTETMRRCWQHTIATAVIAEEIALACEEFTAIAFTAGIMHDIGRLGLLVAFPEEYERVIHDAAARCVDVLDFEEEEFGAHHAEAGRMLAERWGLPEEMALIAGRHHDAVGSAELDLLRIVHVACQLADFLGYEVVKPLTESTLRDVLASLPERARDKLSQNPEELCKRIEQRIVEFGSEPVGPPPEETLALLASATEIAAAGAEPQPENDVIADQPESANEQNRLYHPNLLWVIIGAAVCLALLWALRH